MTAPRHVPHRMPPRLGFAAVRGVLLTLLVVAVAACSSGASAAKGAKPGDYIPSTIEGAPVQNNAESRTQFLDQAKQYGLAATDAAAGLVGNALPERVLVVFRVADANAALGLMPKLFPNATNPKTTTYKGHTITTSTLPSGGVQGGVAWTADGSDTVLVAITITSGPESATTTVQAMLDAAANARG